MSLANQRHIRDQRDHLIDLLGLGETYPLQDLPLYLPAIPYLVTFDNPARIGIETSQRTVLYQMYENGQLVERTPEGTGSIPVERPGNQGRIQLSSYNITEDTTFQFYATKFTYSFVLSNNAFAAELDAAQISSELHEEFRSNGHILLDEQITILLQKPPGLTTDGTGESLPENQPTLTWLLREGDDLQAGIRYLIRRMNDQLVVYEMTNRAAYLHQTAPVKVGLDKALNAWINDADFLDAFQVNPLPTAARLIDFHGQVTVEIENSQEGVFYRLIAGELDGSGAYPADPSPNDDTILSLATEDDEGNGLGKLGTGENITLQTESIDEDIDIRIRATKTFPEAESRANETAVLDVILPVRVRANPAPAITVVPAEIIDYEQEPTIQLASSQASAAYRPYIRPILDREFIHGPTGADVLTVNVPDADAAKILNPSRPHPWVERETYGPGSSENVSGTGAALPLPLSALTADSLVIVKAEKQHHLSTFDQTESLFIASAVQLVQAAMILVRPNPAQALRLEAVIEGNQTNGELAVFDGQPGVFYEFRLSPNTDPLGGAAYFHKVDDSDLTQNKGVSQLAISIDFFVARAYPEPPSTDPAHTIPPPPVLDTGPIAEGSPFQVDAIKAQTLVSVPLDQTALIAALPEIAPEEPIIDYNGETRLLVSDSIIGDRYQPFLNGEVFKQARLGNGDDLVFRTDRLTEDTIYEMRVTQPEADLLALTRSVNLTVYVRPIPDLEFAPVDTEIKAGDSTTIQLHGSQEGVSYQLLIPGDSPTLVGEALVGTGEIINLPTGALTETTEFGIRATKLSNASAVVDFEQTVTVQVAAENEGDNPG